MGIVYEAEQQSPRRPVALKVIRGGALVDEQAVRLFQREAQALARLKHPAIAAIYEAGRTEEGQHFFAMEMVRGESLTDYLARREREGGKPVEIREIVRLFVRICEAVGYAHQRGVIHRDLKPSNILVAAGSGTTPEIKVLDFGLARITDADVQATTVLSEVGRIQGTLPYMSPEQVRGNPDEIDLRSDVYSLGVVLYELLTGALPYEIPRRAIHEAVRIITQEPPKPMSQARAESSSGSASSFSTHRTKRLDRDLETIVLKCLEKEPGRRYQSVAGLAGDLERFLASQPILARPPSAAYQLQKLVRRHRLAFAFLGTVIVLLTGFATTTAVEARRIARERDRAFAAEKKAETEAATSKKVTDFMVDLFKVSDPSESRGNSITAREVLDRGAGKIASELQDQPAVQATLQGALGRVYTGLGLYAQADPILKSALATRRRISGDQSAETALALYDLGNVEMEQWNFAGAADHLRESLEIRRKLFGSHSLEVAQVLHALGTALLVGHLGPTALEESERMAREALEIRQELLGQEHPLVAEALNDLGSVLSWGKEDFAAGEPLLEQSLAMRRRLFGDSHPDVEQSLQGLANHYMRKGNNALAESLYRQTIVIDEKIYGKDHPHLAGTLNDLALLLGKSDALEEAFSIANRVVEIRSRAVGERDSLLVVYLYNLSGVERDLDRPSGAERHLRQALRALPGPNASSHLDAADILDALGGVLVAQRSFEAAEETLRAALSQASTSSLGGVGFRRAQIAFHLAELLEQRGRDAEAKPLYSEVERFSSGPPKTNALRALAYGGSLRGLGRYAEAEPPLLDANEVLQGWLGKRDYRRREARQQLVKLYLAWGKPDQAAKWRPL